MNTIFMKIDYLISGLDLLKILNSGIYRDLIFGLLLTILFLGISIDSLRIIKQRIEKNNKNKEDEQGIKEKDKKNKNIIKVINNIIKILGLGLIAVILVIFIGTSTLYIQGCNYKQNEEKNITQWLILNKTEAEYISELKVLLTNIYSEDNLENQEDLYKSARKYMTEDCAKYITSKNLENYKVSIVKINCKVDKISLAYSNHQEDKITKVIAHLTLSNKEMERNITLEMRINEEDMIYEIIIW